MSSPQGLPRSNTAPVFPPTRPTSEHRQPQRKVSGNHVQGSSGVNNATRTPESGPHSKRDRPKPDMSGFNHQVVEEFGERLDRWKAKKNLAPERRRKAAVDLVKQYRAVAREQFVELASQYKHQIERRSRKYWRRQLLADHTDDSLLISQADQQAEDAALDELSQWQAEYDTWQLVEDLLFVRHPGSDSRQSRRNISGHTNDRYTADGSTFNEFLSDSELTRERLIVMKWLERTAAANHEKSTDILEEELEQWSKRDKALWTSGWMDTKERIKAEKRFRSWNTSLDDLPDLRSSDGSRMVQQLDPDAATRLKRPTDPADSKFNAAFWRMCLEMLRQGQPMDRVRDWCESCNEYSAAALIGAAFEQIQDHDEAARAIARYRWRQMCNAVAASQNDPHLDAFYRAVMGLLGGNVSAVQPTSSDWKDLLYTRLNAQVVNSYQAFVKQQFSSLLPPDQLHAFGSRPPIDTDQTIESILEEVRSDRNTRFKASTHADLSIIQMSLISNNITKLLMEQGATLASDATQSEEHDANHGRFVLADVATLAPKHHGFKPLYENPTSLRILAHIYLILEYLAIDYGTPDQHETWHRAAQNVCSAYIHYIEGIDKFLLIPLYVCNLSPDLASHVMAQVMPFIDNINERSQTLKLMEECHLDVFNILDQYTQYQLRELRDGRPPPDGTQSAEVHLLEPDKRYMWPAQRIRLLEEAEPTLEQQTAATCGEWYILASGHWSETFEMLLDVAENFLLHTSPTRYHALTDLIQRLPPSKISLAKTEALFGAPVDVFNESEDPALHLPDDLADAAAPLQLQAQPYTHCAHLIDAISAMWNWRLAEDRYLRAHQGPGQCTDPEARAEAAKAIGELRGAMACVLEPGFLMLPNADPASVFPSSSTPQETYAFHRDRLSAIRESYLPELLVAYNTALQPAAHLCSRDHFIASLELGRTIAGNPEFLRCLQKARRMRELLDGLARTSYAMLQLNEQKPAASKVRGKSGKTLGIWDITA